MAGEEPKAQNYKQMEVHLCSSVVKASFKGCLTIYLFLSLSLSGYVFIVLLLPCAEYAGLKIFLKRTL